jgi:hypothetical protein
LAFERFTWLLGDLAETLDQRKDRLFEQIQRDPGRLMDPGFIVRRRLPNNLLEAILASVPTVSSDPISTNGDQLIDGAATVIRYFRDASLLPEVRLPERYVQTVNLLERLSDIVEQRTAQEETQSNGEHPSDEDPSNHEYQPE